MCNNNHVVIENESIAWELNIDQWRMNDDLKVVYHTPELIERASKKKEENISKGYDSQTHAMVSATVPAYTDTKQPF